MSRVRDGDVARALSPDLGWVDVVYRTRDLELDSGVTVPAVLVGVHEPSGQILLVPAQVQAQILMARVAARAGT